MNGVRVLSYHKYACPFSIFASLLGFFAATSMKSIVLNWARSFLTFKEQNMSMRSLKNRFSNFFYFYKEVVYLIALSYLIFISIIVMLSLVVCQQKQTIIFLQNGINRQETRQHINKPRVKRLLESEYRMIIKPSHR